MGFAARSQPVLIAQVVSGDALSVFQSDLGWIGLVGSEDNVLSLSYGHTASEGVRRDLDQKLGDSRSLPEGDWSPEIRELLQSYAAGEWADFSKVRLRWGTLTTFRRAVIRAVRRIRYGETSSYGEVAASAGFPRAARAVGTVMANNPLPLIVPCHRVVGSAGKLGGYSARMGVTMKARLLEMEQAVDS